MKKLIAAIVAILLALPLTASCGSEKAGGVAFICGPSGIADRYEGQGINTALEAYCTENGISYTVYTSDGNAGYYQKAAASAARHADLIVCGSEASEALSSDTASYAGTSFLLVNSGASGISANARTVSFCEEDAGYIAGYAAVSDGKRNFGYIAGKDNEMNRRYLNGFLQGIDAAAAVRATTHKVEVCFTGETEASDDIKSAVIKMYTDGADAVMVCGGMIYKSAVSAANTVKSTLIGAEIDQAGESESFVTSAIKEYSKVLGGELAEFYKEKAWSGAFMGSGALYRFADGCVGIPTYTGAFRFKNYTIAEYESLKTMLTGGGLTVNRSALSTYPTLASTQVTEIEFVRTPEVSEASQDSGTSSSAQSAVSG